MEHLNDCVGCVWNLLRSLAWAVFFMYSHDQFTWHSVLRFFLNVHDLAHGIGVALISLVFFIVVYLKNVPSTFEGR